MRIIGLAACLAATAVLTVAAAMPADAQQRTRQQVSRSDQTVFVSRDENGRTRTRIIVTPRSYLDGGTHVLPGQRKFTDYAIPPFWSPLDVLGPGKNYDRQPLNPIWESGWTRSWN